MLVPNEYRHDGNLSDQLALLRAILGDIAGSIAGPYYGSMPEVFREKIQTIIPEEFIEVLTDFVWANNDIAKTICEEPRLDRHEIFSKIS